MVQLYYDDSIKVKQFNAGLADMAGDGVQMMGCGCRDVRGETVSVLWLWLIIKSRLYLAFIGRSFTLGVNLCI